MDSMIKKIEQYLSVNCGAHHEGLHSGGASGRGLRKDEKKTKRPKYGRSAFAILCAAAMTMTTVAADLPAQAAVNRTSSYEGDAADAAYDENTGAAEGGAGEAAGSTNAGYGTNSDDASGDVSGNTSGENTGSGADGTGDTSASGSNDAGQSANENDAAQDQDSEQATDEATSEENTEEAASYASGTLTYGTDDDAYKVSVTFDESALLPEGTTLSAAEIPADNDEDEYDYDNYLAQAQNKLNEENEKNGVDAETIDAVHFYDILFTDADSNKVEPDPNANLQVSISYKDGLEKTEEQSVQIFHFTDDNDTSTDKIDLFASPELAGDDTNVKVDEVKFDTNQFSVYAVALTSPVKTGKEAAAEETGEGNTENASVSESTAADAEEVTEGTKTEEAAEAVTQSTETSEEAQEPENQESGQKENAEAANTESSAESVTEESTVASTEEKKDGSTDESTTEETVDTKVPAVPDMSVEKDTENSAEENPSLLQKIQNGLKSLLGIGQPTVKSISGSQIAADGTYTAKMTSYKYKKGKKDDTYTGYLTVTVSNGKIASMSYEGDDKKGKVAAAVSSSDYVGKVASISAINGVDATSGATPTSTSGSSSSYSSSEDKYYVLGIKEALVTALSSAEPSGNTSDGETTTSDYTVAVGSSVEITGTWSSSYSADDYNNGKWNYWFFDTDDINSKTSDYMSLDWSSNKVTVTGTQKTSTPVTLYHAFPATDSDAGEYWGEGWHYESFTVSVTESGSTTVTPVEDGTYKGTAQVTNAQNTNTYTLGVIVTVSGGKITSVVQDTDTSSGGGDWSGMLSTDGDKHQLDRYIGQDAAVSTVDSVSGATIIGGSESGYAACVRNAISDALSNGRVDSDSSDTGLTEVETTDTEGTNFTVKVTGTTNKLPAGTKLAVTKKDNSALSDVYNAFTGDIKSDANKDTIDNSSFDFFQLYDIHLEDKNGETYEPDDTKFNLNVTITFDELPDGLANGDEVYIGHYSDDGTAKELSDDGSSFANSVKKVKVSGNSISFHLKSFSDVGVAKLKAAPASGTYTGTLVSPSTLSSGSGTDQFIIVNPNKNYAMTGSIVTGSPNGWGTTSVTVSGNNATVSDSAGVWTWDYSTKSLKNNSTGTYLNINSSNGAWDSGMSSSSVSLTPYTISSSTNEGTLYNGSYYYLSFSSNKFRVYSVSNTSSIRSSYGVYFYKVEAASEQATMTNPGTTTVTSGGSVTIETTGCSVSGATSSNNNVSVSQSGNTLTFSLASGVTTAQTATITVTGTATGSYTAPDAISFSVTVNPSSSSQQEQESVTSVNSITGVTSLTVTKTFAGTPEGTSATVSLTGTGYDQSFTFNSTNGWSHQFTGLTAANSYTLTETAADGSAAGLNNYTVSMDTSGLPSGGSSGGYSKSGFNSISADGSTEYVLVYGDSTNGYYALTASGSSVSGTPITISNDKITSTITDSMKWKFGTTTYSIYTVYTLQNSETGTYLRDYGSISVQAASSTSYYYQRFNIDTSGESSTIQGVDYQDYISASGSTISAASSGWGSSATGTSFTPYASGGGNNTNTTGTIAITNTYKGSSGGNNTSGGTDNTGDMTTTKSVIDGVEEVGPDTTFGLNLEAYANGSKVTTTTTSGGDPADILLVFDQTNSLSSNGGLEALRSAASNFVNNLPTNSKSKIALMTFIEFYANQSYTAPVTTRMGWTSLTDGTKSALSSLISSLTVQGSEYGYGTSYLNPLQQASSMLSSSSNSKKYVIFFSDGDADCDELSSIQSAASSLQSQATVFSVASGSFSNYSKINAVASSGSAYQASDTASLTNVFSQILSQIETTTTVNASNTTLDANAEFRDVINTSYFDASEATATVTVYDYDNGTWTATNGTATTGSSDSSGTYSGNWTNKHSNDGTLTINIDRNSGEVSVTGFSYKDHYLLSAGEPSGVNSQKLVVQITGLKLKSGAQTTEKQTDVHTNKDGSSGIYPSSSSSTRVKDFPQPDVDIPATESGTTPGTSGTDSVIVKKVWKDENGDDMAEADIPSYITVELESSSGSRSAIISSSDDWQKSITGLEDNVTYTLSETGVTDSEGNEQLNNYVVQITKENLSRNFPTGGTGKYTTSGNDYHYTYDNATSFNSETGRANYSVSDTVFDGDVYIDSNVTVSFENCTFKGSVIPADNSAIADFEYGNAFYYGNYGALNMSGGNVFAQKAVNTAITSGDNVRVSFPTAISINGLEYDLVTSQTSMSRPSWASVSSSTGRSGNTTYRVWTVTGTTPSQAGMQLFLVTLAYRSAQGNDTYTFSVPMYLQVGNVDVTSASTIPVYTITNSKKAEIDPQNPDIPAKEIQLDDAVTVRKYWADGTTPAGSVTVQVYSTDNTYTSELITLNSSNNWSYTLEGLDSSLTYKVRETAVEGSTTITDDYDVSIEQLEDTRVEQTGNSTGTSLAETTETTGYTFNYVKSQENSSHRVVYTVNGHTFSSSDSDYTIYSDNITIAQNVTVIFTNCTFRGVSIVPADSSAVVVMKGRTVFQDSSGNSILALGSTGDTTTEVNTLGTLPTDFTLTAGSTLGSGSSAFVGLPNSSNGYTLQSVNVTGPSWATISGQITGTGNYSGYTGRNITGTTPSQPGYQEFTVSVTYRNNSTYSSYTLTMPMNLNIGSATPETSRVTTYHTFDITNTAKEAEPEDNRITVTKQWSGVTPASGTTVVITATGSDDEEHTAVLSSANSWTAKVSGTDFATDTYTVTETSVTDRSGGDIKGDYQSAVSASGTAAKAGSLAAGKSYVFVNSSKKALSYSSGLGTADVALSDDGNDITTEDISSSVQWTAVANGSGFRLRNGTNRYLRVNSGTLTTTTTQSYASTFTYSNGRLSTTSGSTTYYVSVSGSSASATTTATDLGAYAVGSSSSYTITNSEKSTPVNPDNPTTETPDHHKSADGDGSDEDPYTIHLNVTGKQQTSSETTKTGNVVDVVLVADVSGSMTSTKISNIRTAANSFVDTVLGSSSNLDARMALVEFGAAYNASSHEDDQYLLGEYTGYTWDDAKTDQTWTTSSSSMTTAINSLSSTDSSTNVEAGLREAATLLESARSNAQKIVILLSDGQPNIFYNSQGYSPYASGQSAAAISAAEAQADAMVGTVDAFYTVATGAGEGSDDMSFLETIAQKFTKNGSYTATDSSGLTSAFSSIGTAITTTTTKTLSAVTITDHLTEYVQLSGTSSNNYGVTVTDSNGGTVNSSNYTVSVPYSDGKTIVVKFIDSFTFTDGVTYTVNIPITTTDKATETVNASDSDKVKLPTNTSAEIDYTYGDASGSDTYPEEPTIDVTKTATGESDASYLQVTKTFTGIDADDIPSTFYMTATTGSGSDATTYNLMGSRNADGITLTKSSDGLTWTWKIKDAATGTYTVTEYDAKVEDKNLSTTFNGGTEKKITVNDDDTSLSDSVTVSAADVQNDKDDPLTVITSGSNLTKDMGSANGKIKLFVIRQTGSNGAIVISEKSLNASVRKALEENILSNMSNGGDWTNGGVTYYVGSQLADKDFTIAKGTIRYNTSENTITFSSSNQWSMVAYGSISGNGLNVSDIIVSNNYSNPNEVVLTGVLASPLGRVMTLMFAALAAVAVGSVYLRRRRKMK